MVLNPKKTVVVTNVPKARASVKAAWRNRITIRDLGVDLQWGPWRNPVQQGSDGTFQKAVFGLRHLGLAAPQKVFTIKILCPVAFYGGQTKGTQTKGRRGSEENCLDPSVQTMDPKGIKVLAGSRHNQTASIHTKGLSLPGLRSQQLASRGWLRSPIAASCGSQLDQSHFNPRAQHNQGAGPSDAEAQIGS